MFKDSFRQCPAGSVPYTIKAGDTLYFIARRNNISLASIIAANPGINPNRLYIGQRICIPTGSGTPSCSGYYYTIRRGDTLYRIAQLITVPLTSLIAANPGINPNNLIIGQRICIPSIPGALPLVKQIPVFVEGQTDYREARLQRSEQGYLIYVLDNFVFTGEEPGSDLLFSSYDSSFDARIQKYPAQSDINTIRQNSITELQYTGTPVEMKGEEIFDPFFRSAKFFLHASNPTLSKNIILIEIGNNLYRFTVNIPNTEAAEWLAPSIYAMLKTIIDR